LPVVHPGKHEYVPPVFATQSLLMPAVLLPQLVSVLEAHVVLHHVPSQVVPAAQALQGEVVAVLQGSPTSPLVPAQIDPVPPLPMGWQVVPATGVQSAFVVHPGKQM